MKETYCDKCNKKFSIKLKTKTHKVVIKETYFICPHCKEKYTAFVTDAECRKMQRDIRTLKESKSIPAKEFANNEISEDQYVKAIDVIAEEIKGIQFVLSQKMNELKKTFA